MAPPVHRLLIRKPLADVRDDSQGLTRTLGPIQLTLIGIGCIVGAGVYVMTGTAAANYAGPAVILSFALAGIACAFTALCYAELSSTLPVAGASYSYAYAALGELAAWTLGWMISLEMGLAGSLLAVGASGYLLSLLADFGVHLPAMLTNPYVQSITRADGQHFAVGGSINLVAVALVAIFTAVLVRGVSHSARLNAVMVTVKIGVLVLFVALGASHVHSANWHPFIPASQGGFTYGWAGVLRGASVLFFAYLGFEAVATAALEAKQPAARYSDRHPGRAGSGDGCLHDGGLRADRIGALYVAQRARSGCGRNRRDRHAVADFPDQDRRAGGAVIGADDQHLCPFTDLFRDGRRWAVAEILLRHPPRAFAPRTSARYSWPAWPGWRRQRCRYRSWPIWSAWAPAWCSLPWQSARSGCATPAPTCRAPFRVPGGSVTIGGVWFGTVPVLSLLMTVAMVGPVLGDIGYKAAHGDRIPAVILALYVLAGAVVYRLVWLSQVASGHRLARYRNLFAND